MKTYELKKHRGFRLSRVAFTLIMGCVGTLVASTYCLHGPSEPCYYQPTVPCSDHPKYPMCFKWCTYGAGYGFGGCVSTGLSEQECTDGELAVRVREFFGTCDGMLGNCHANTNLVNVDGMRSGTYSWDSSPCGAG
jgi:hypothetical protein